MWDCATYITWGVAAWNQLGVGGLKKLEASFGEQLDDPRVHGHLWVQRLSRQAHASPSQRSESSYT